MRKRSRLADLVSIGPVTPPSANGASAAKLPVAFDAGDGKKRVLITIDAEGKFEPIIWWAMSGTDNDGGAHEANVIVAHAGLICAEEVWKRSVAPAQSQGEISGNEPDSPR
jgi:hypothetical protein